MEAEGANESAGIGSAGLRSPSPAGLLRSRPLPQAESGTRLLTKAVSDNEMDDRQCKGIY